ncbi:MAG: hypothetical protein O7D30_13140 [Rickettsia endosymbiont of Ixodes persulcatus]|nr:hypothetical protein [Rickettsia endosymbiont of Ixodes persulcatus]
MVSNDEKKMPLKIQDIVIDRVGKYKYLEFLPMRDKISRGTSGKYNYKRETKFIYNEAQDTMKQ